MIQRAMCPNQKNNCANTIRCKKTEYKTSPYGYLLTIY